MQLLDLAEKTVPGAQANMREEPRRHTLYRWHSPLTANRPVSEGQTTPEKDKSLLFVFKSSLRIDLTKPYDFGRQLHSRKKKIEVL